MYVWHFKQTGSPLYVGDANVVTAIKNYIATSFGYERDNAEKALDQYLGFNLEKRSNLSFAGVWQQI